MPRYFFIYLILYLYVACLSLFLPSVPINYQLKAVLIISTWPIGAYLYLHHFALFVPTLFFLLNAILVPVSLFTLSHFSLPIPQLYFLPSILIYLFIVLKIPKYRTEITWLKWGKIDKITTMLILSMGALTALSLLLWAIFIKKDLSEFRAFIPQIPWWQLGLYGLLFPVFNAIFEEFISRALLYDGFLRVFKSTTAVILSQALVFALWHYQGFPGGVVGVMMVFVWSVFLGAIRFRSGGMIAPLIAHFLADLSIAVILLFLVILPNS